MSGLRMNTGHGVDNIQHRTLLFGGQRWELGIEYFQRFNLTICALAMGYLWFLTLRQSLISPRHIGKPSVTSFFWHFFGIEE